MAANKNKEEMVISNNKKYRKKKGNDKIFKNNM